MAAGNKDDVLLGKLFKEFDRNKDGYINFFEFESLLEKLKINYEKRLLGGVFNKIDTNRSGVIEF